MKALGLLPYVVVIAALWFFLLRPQAKRRNEAAQALRDRLVVGAEVLLTSGIFGRVTAIDDDAVHVAISDAVTVRVIRSAIGHVIERDAQHDDNEQHSPEIESGDDAGPEEH